MSGRDENGVLIKASTTTLYTPARWGVFIGDATGGDFTLTYGGNTTAAIAYNATDSDKEAALHLLAGLDATNCRVFDGCVHFLGNLSPGKTVSDASLHFFGRATGGGIVSDFFVEYSDLIPGGYYVVNEAGYDNIPSSVIVSWLESVAGVGGVATS